MFRRPRPVRCVLAPVLALLAATPGCGGSGGGTGPGPAPTIGRLTVQPNPLSVAQRDSVQLQIVARDESDRVIANPRLDFTLVGAGQHRIAVSGTGMVRGIADGGPASVRVTPEGAGSPSVTVPVTVLSLPSRVLLSPDSMPMHQGDEWSVQVIVRDTLGYTAYPPTLVREILDPAIASVTSLGAISADGKAGLTRFRVTASANGAVAVAEIPVYVGQDAGQVLVADTVHVPEGGSVAVSFSVLDRAGDPIPMTDIILQSQAPALFSIAGDATITSLAGPGSGGVLVRMPHFQTHVFQVVVDPAP